jgi:PAS domain S-box-containing protein
MRGLLEELQPVATAPAPVAPANGALPDVPLAIEDSDTELSHAALLEYTHDAIIIWELRGRGIQYWNQAAERLYGYSREEAHGKVTHALLHTEVKGGVETMESTLARYGVWLGELRHTTRDGRKVAVEGRLALLSQENGRWLVLEVNRDITNYKVAEAERDRVEAQLAELRAMIESANKGEGRP